jgi:hypothetical protein
MVQLDPDVEDGHFLKRVRRERSGLFAVSSVSPVGRKTPRHGKLLIGRTFLH